MELMSRSLSLDQPVLKRQMRLLNTAFGRTSFCTDGLNVQFVHRTTKLRVAIAVSGIFIITPEYTGFIAVKSQRFAVFSI
jgi:hypothetical protein